MYKLTAERKEKLKLGAKKFGSGVASGLRSAGSAIRKYHDEAPQRRKREIEMLKSNIEYQGLKNKLRLLEEGKQISFSRHSSSPTKRKTTKRKTTKRRRTKRKTTKRKKR